MSLEDEWLKQSELIELNKDNYTTPIVINEKEFVVCKRSVISRQNDNNDETVEFEVCTFNTEKNKWDINHIGDTVQFPKRLLRNSNRRRTLHRSIVFDKQKKILYLLDSKGCLWDVNLWNQFITRCRLIALSDTAYDHCCGYNGINTGFLQLINNQLFLYKVLKDCSMETMIKNLDNKSGLIDIH